MSISPPSGSRRRRAVVAVTAAAALTVAGVLVGDGGGHHQAAAHPGGAAVPSSKVAAAALRQITPKTPAPSSFPAELKATYASAVAYSGLPGVGPSGSVTPTSALLTTAAFDKAVDDMTPTQLAEAYDQDPAAWSQLARSIQQVTAAAPPSLVATDIGQYDSALAGMPGAVSKLAGGARAVTEAAAAGTSYAPPTPVIFNAPNCPTYNLGGDDGYDTLYGLQLAIDATNLLANPSLPFGAAIPGIAVVAVLQGTYDTFSLLVNLSQACGNASSAAETDVINGNTIDLDNTTIALLELDNQIQSQEESIQALLDSRTTTIINGLDTAQASLNAAQYQNIEESLAGGSSTAVASYELPASLGGYLNSTPIGVQAIVTTAISDLEEANQPVSPSASGDLTQANNLLTAGQYKAAYAEYQTAYQAINN